MSYDLGPKIGIDGETEFRKQISAINTNLKTLGSEMKVVTTAFIGQENSEKSLTAQNQVLGKTVTELSSKLDLQKKMLEKVSSEYEEGDEHIAKYQQMVNRTQAELNKAEAEIRKNNETMQDLGKTAEDTGGKVSGLGDKLKNGLATAAKAGAAALAAATAAVGAFAVASIKVGAEFDHSMSQVAATMGKTMEELNSEVATVELSTGTFTGTLREFAQQMGATTVFSATEAADALNYMALAGYDAEESMQALPNVLNLAAAGGIELASASDMVTDAQSALGLSMEESAELVDKMAMTASKSNTSVEQLGQAILTVGGTAKNLAGGTTELSTALGILADNGVKGAEGGTALRNIILSLTAPTDAAADTMKKLGVEVFDAEGNMKPLNETFGALNESLSKLTQEEQIQALSDIFNKRDLKSVNALLANTGERFDELSGYIDNAAGAAEQMANTQLDNLNGDITLFKSALEGAQIAISDQLTPTLREWVQFGSEAVSTLSQAFQDGGLSGAMDALGTILSDGLSMVMEQLPEMVDAGMQLLGALGEGLNDNLPVIVDAATEIFGTLTSNLLEAAPELLDSAITIITTLADGLTEQLPELIPVAIDAILQLAETLTDPDSLGKMVDSAIGLIMALADGLIEGLPKLIEKAPVIIENLVMGIANNLPKLLQSGVTLVLKLAAGIIQAIPQLVQSIPQIISAIVNGFVSYASKIMDIGKNIVKGIWDGITGMASWIKDKITGFFGGIVDGVKSFLGIHSPSTLFRDEIGYNMGLGVAQGLDKSSNKAEKAASTLAKNVYTASKDWLDKNTKYLNLSLQDQLEVWEAIQSQFVHGSQQYADAEEQIFDLRQKIQKEHDDAVISSAQKAVKLQGTTTAEQLAIWEDAQKRVLEGSQQYQKAEEQVYKLREQVMTEFEASAKEIFATAETIQKEYDDALAKRTESIYGIYGLFNKAAEAEKVSAKELIKNLDSQVESLGSFYAGLDQLAERSFVPDDLIEEIRGMGPKVAGQLDALLNMDDDQLQTYTDLYVKKHELAAAQAANELVALKDETDQKVAEQLQALEQLFDANAPDIGKSLVDGLAQGIRDHNSTVINAAVEMAKATIAAAKDTLGIHSPSTVFASIGGNMALGLAQGWEEDFAKVRREIQSGLNFDAGAVSANLTVPGLTASNVQPDFSDLMAGMVNGVQTAVTGAGSDLPQSATIVLQTPEGMTVARWLLPDLRAAMRDDPDNAV